MTQILVGTVLRGHCHGYFGRDYYNEDKRVEAVGADWIVAREGGRPVFAEDRDIHTKLLGSQTTEVLESQGIDLEDEG